VPRDEAVARWMGRAYGVVDEKLADARLLAWTSPAYRVDALKRELDALPAFTPLLWSDIDAVDGEALFPAEAPARRQNSSSHPSRFARSGRIKSGGEDEQRDAQRLAAAATADEKRKAQRRAAAAAAQAKAAAKSVAKAV
jgi:hypothetical protein